uniref:transglutaminase-like domain-containing protein n=2 Tax=Flavobacterium sp. TaxID=239 RepID=UPI0040490E1D
MKNFLILFLFFSLSNLSFSQETQLGKVTIEELQKTQSDIDPEAPAEYIFKKGWYFLEPDAQGTFSLNIKVNVKIKIYSKEGYDFANFELPVYEGRRKVTAYFTNAITYNLVDGKIKKTKLKKDGEFVEKVNEHLDIRKISMPNVKEGSIIEFSYKYKTYNFQTFPEWFFQYEIPIQFCSLMVSTPQRNHFFIHLKPYLEVEKKSFFLKATGRNDYDKLYEDYEVMNVNSYRKEAFVTHINNYIPSVKYELSTLTDYNPNSVANHYEYSWDDVSKNIYGSKYFGKELKKDGYFEADLSKYILENESKYNKTEAVFNFVKERMSWNGYNSFFTDLGVEEAYEEKTGNTGDINLMLIAMFKSQGIKANPVIISTRSNGIMNLPSIFAYNYVVAGIETEDGILLYDATSKNATENIVPLRALNWFGRMIYETRQSAAVDLIPKRASNSSLNSVIEIKNDGSISGKYREQMTDYYAFLYRENYGLLAQEINKERIQKKLDNAEVLEVKLQNLKDLNQPIVEEVTFNKLNAVDFIGDKIYFNPTFMFGLKANPFLSETRDFPIDFDFPTESKHLIIVKIPEGFEIESLPISTVLAFQENMLEYRYQLKKINNSIQISMDFNINSAIISSEYYSLIKDFFTKVVEKNNEQVVLRKI